MDITSVSGILIYGVPAVAIIVGLVKVAKEVFLPTKYAPLASIGLGIVLGLTLYPSAQGAVTGIALGLVSCGIYDVVKQSGDIANDK